MRQPARGLFDRITEFDTLWLAARRARRGKRRTSSTAAFEADLERELLQLQDELRSGTYRFGPYRTFTVREPTERLVSAAPYRDRVVHHAICAYLEPLLERQMIDQSFACRIGKGTHRALDLLQHYLRGGRWVLKVDVRKYFHTIDHAVLRADLRQVVGDGSLLALLDQLIATHDSGAEYWFAMPGDDMFAALRPRGVPIGNLTSQLFANSFLTPLDRAIKREVRCRRYVRYMDDLVLVGDSKAQVRDWRDAIVALLERRRLLAHPRKTQLYPVGNGVPFLGFQVYPYRRRLRRSGIRRFMRRMRCYAASVGDGSLDSARVGASLTAWFGVVRPAQHRRFVERLLSGISFQPPGAALPFTWIPERA